MPADMPAAEVDISATLVRTLLRRQFPEHADEALEVLANGWDNALFRVGDALVARFPRRQVAVPLIEAEQRWLPELAPSLPLAVPAPIGVGVPDLELGYRWPWSLCPYLPGRSLLSLLDEGGALADPVADARRLGAFHAALHRPAPPDAPPNPLRGVPLADRHERLVGQLADLGPAIDQRRARALWDDAVGAPAWDGPPLWLHGDPHPGNLLTDGERITAVVDFGDITAGDRATDLAGAWMALPADARSAYGDAVGADDDTWRRARGWALCMGVAILATSEDNPPYRRLGERTVAAVLADAP